MNINIDTKIASLLKHNPEALEKIVSIDPLFEKLRNPLLRKIMAGRTSIGMACKIAGCEARVFFEKLLPLGFKAEIKNVSQSALPIPEFMQQINKLKVIDFDVRPVFDKNDDPLKAILDKINCLKNDEVLKIVNTFEPLPLIKLLEKRGFDSWTDVKSEWLIVTYFHHTGKAFEEKSGTSTDTWESVRENFPRKTIQIDVRHLNMPQPMMKILSELENLPKGFALEVLHKKVPVHLLPELKERNFKIVYRTIKDGEVELLIYRG